MVDQMDDRVDHFTEVVRRDVGGHADGDALAAVDEQVGEPGGQHFGLLGAAVVVGHHVDGVFVDAFEQLHCQRMQPALGVAGRRRTEVG